MAMRTVHSCDWCGTDVPKKTYTDGADFGAHVAITTGTDLTEEFDVCRDCAKALRAVQEGRYKR